MKLLILAAFLLPAASAAPTSPGNTAPAPAPNAAPAPPEDSDSSMPVLGQSLPSCPSVLQQVAGENRKHRGSRLDQQPPAHMLLAVDRTVNGCREVTFLRRNVAPAPAMPDSEPEAGR